MSITKFKHLIKEADLEDKINNVVLNESQLKEDARQLKNEGLVIASVVDGLLTLHVISSLILTMLKLFIKLVLPKSFVDFEEKNIGAVDKLLNFTTIIVKHLDKLAKFYISSIEKVLAVVPKYKNLDANSRKKIAVTVYYVVTVGFILKVIKLIIIKKGLSPDAEAIKVLKQSIIDGLKLTTHEVDFDNIEKEGDILFSKEGLSPIVSLITSQITNKLNIS
jgi:hypothetical protein